MRIGFLCNQIDNRGTGNAMFDYAHYNETILGNESYIYTFSNGQHDPLAIQKYQRRFKTIGYIDAQKVVGLDAIYHIKSGEDDGIRFNIPYLVHAVFRYAPHGTRYAMVSRWLAMVGGNDVPYVPHIINLPDIRMDIRDSLGLPRDAVVFGRYGGFDSFDLDFAWPAIRRALVKRDDIYFLFMNTQAPQDMHEHPRVFFMDPTNQPEYKRMFINSCDAMIHARARGETFGIAVGEFAVCDKPILTYRNSPEQAHRELAATYSYSDEDELVTYLTTDWWRRDADYCDHRGYKLCTPENVMKQFKEVFLA